MLPNSTSRFGSEVKSWLAIGGVCGAALLWALTQWGNAMWFPLERGVANAAMISENSQRLHGVEQGQTKLVLAVTRLERQQLALEKFRVDIRVENGEATEVERRFLVGVQAKIDELTHKIERLELLVGDR